jgi:hypothetical protein
MESKMVNDNQTANITEEIYTQMVSGLGYSDFVESKRHPQRLHHITAALDTIFHVKIFNFPQRLGSKW